MEKIQDKTYNQHVKMDLDRHSENNIGNVRGGVKHNKKENIKNRNINIDIIRIIAACGVIGLHCFDKDYSLLSSSLYYLCVLSIPLFFMSSGYFMLNKTYTHKKLIYKAIKIFRTTLIWAVIIVMLKLITGNIDTNLLIDFAKIYFGSYIQKQSLWHFWFMGSMIILYILFPIISKFLNKSNIFLTSIFFICITVQFISYIKGVPIQKHVIQTFRIWTWILYFCLGGIIERRQEQLCNFINIRLNTALILLLTIVSVVFENCIGRTIFLYNTGENVHAEYFYDDILIIMWAILLFIFINRINIRKNKKIYLAIGRLANLTPMVYILHPLILSYIFNRLFPLSTLGIFAKYFSTVAVSFALSYIISKTKIYKYLIF